MVHGYQNLGRDIGTMPSLSAHSSPIKMSVVTKAMPSIVTNDHQRLGRGI